jgi:hypothetical protein
MTFLSTSFNKILFKISSASFIFTIVPQSCIHLFLNDNFNILLRNNSAAAGAKGQWQDIWLNSDKYKSRGYVSFYLMMIDT